MIHTALARKYRPTRFSDLVAQEHVAAGLAGAIGKNRVAHAYLLTGPRGVGKTSAARILAMALNCAQRGEGGADAGEPCGTCESCRRIWSGAANLDVAEMVQLDGEVTVGITAYGGAGNDTIWGSQAGDNLAGGTGDDEIHGQEGVDHIYGDSGFDVDYEVVLGEDDIHRVSRELTVPTFNTSEGLTRDNLVAGSDTIYGDGANVAVELERGAPSG